MNVQTLTPEMLREHAKRERTQAWDGQARQLLNWAADLLEAAKAVIYERAPREANGGVQDSPCNSGAQALSGRGADEAEMAPIGLEGDRAAGTGSRTPAMSFEQWATTLNANASDLGSYARLAWDSAWRYAKQLYVKVADGPR